MASLARSALDALKIKKAEYEAKGNSLAVALCDAEIKKLEKQLKEAVSHNNA